MKIQTKDKYGQQYYAEIVKFEPDLDFIFEVDYYDDEGVLVTERVTHERLLLDKEIRNGL
jgi:hypothetical protein